MRKGETLRRGSLALAAAALAFAACGGGAAPPGEPGAKPPSRAEGAAGFESRASPTGSSADAAALADAARRLAGLEAGGDPIWSQHAARMDELWRGVEERHAAAMRAWSEATLAPLVPEPELPLFYPFGGPDFLGAFLFFPAAPLYVLVGLQPPGSLPRLDEIPPAALAAELARLRRGFQSLAEAGYFQQIDMDSDFDAARLDGVLPVLYVFLVRTGHLPLAVRHLGLDENGRLTEPGAGAASAVAIDFVRAGEERRRTLLYFAQDLSDEGLVRQHPELARYLRNLGEWNVLMKAAVYLLHMGGFAALRELLLEHTRTLLQDDSGLPLRELATDRWDLRFFGAYTRTLPVYRQWFQEDLAAAFAGDPSIPRLGFAIGYHGTIGEGCLILANRRPAP